MQYSPSILLILYNLILLSYIFTRGFYSFGAFTAMFTSLILLITFFFKPASLSKNVLRLPLNTAIVLTLITSVFLTIILYGGMYQQKNIFYLTSLYLLSFAGLLSITYFFDFQKSLSNLYRFRLQLMLGIALLTQIFMIISSPHPKIDVFDQLKLGSAGLLKGINPYSQEFPQIYNYPQDYFPYLPLTAIVVLPFNLILGDPRFTIVAANILTVYILRKILATSKKALAYEVIPLIYIFHPQMNFMIEQAWIDPIIFATFTAFIYSVMDKKGGFISTLLLGISISLKQTFIVLLPFLLLFNKMQKKIIFGALVILILSIIPFYFWNSDDFINDVVIIHIERRLWWHNSLTFNSFILSEFKKNIDNLFFFVVWIGLLVTILKRGTRNFTDLTLSISLWFFTFYLFNYQAYIHYYVFVSNLMILSSASALTQKA